MLSQHSAALELDLKMQRQDLEASELEALNLKLEALEVEMLNHLLVALEAPSLHLVKLLLLPDLGLRSHLRQ